MRINFLLTLLLLLTSAAPSTRAADHLYSVGVSAIDITPDYPIRLCGYVARKTESQGVEQKLWAKALAIGDDGSNVSVIVTVDNTAVPASVIDAAWEKVNAKIHLPRERLVVCSSHTHCAPCVAGGIQNMFGEPLAAEQQAKIDRYTRELTDDLEKVILAAVADRKPAHLSWAIGEADFAANRRTKGGPVEHALPVLIATDRSGAVRAILANYACHCTTLGPDFNKICGDWAGYAQQYIAEQHPGALAMISIGTAGDANPQPRGTLAMAQQHGRELADAVNKVLAGKLTALDAPITAQFTKIALPYEPLRSKEQWEELAKRTDAIGGNARLQLAKLNRGESLPTELPYRIATWTFGNELAMVFLAGEVVVDYDLRLKTEFDPQRLWVTAYANDVCCYIPSKRVLAEGGYEAEGAMTYYGRPGKFAPGIENQIVRTVTDLLPTNFRSAPSLKEFPPPMSPAESMATIHVRDDLQVELVASEPLIEDPVAIDWGADGRLWVAEMRDYPNGIHENMIPGGRIKVLSSSHHDGHYDRASVFLDGLRMPDGVMAWGKGVLICAAPDIIYAEDTKGTGKADLVKVLFSGFGPANEQWLVNGLSLGLDNWVYGASSIANDPIKSLRTGKVTVLGNRDFRMHPDTGEFEPAEGRTQYCRVRDDWGNWFGNDNSNLLWNYPLPDHYLRRNPAAVAPHNVLAPSGYDFNQLYPISRMLERFNSPQSAGRTTSACGLTIYRDDLMGSEFYGNAFGCEPVHNMVYRLVLEPDGITFKAHRAPEEQKSEFLAATDNWFRPVQVRTGPDGALWVVDMYRFVIEHPRWIPPERLARLDIRAGADKGRIYRVYAKNSHPREIPDLSKLPPKELAKWMDNKSGTLRDTVQRLLVEKKSAEAAPALMELTQSSNSAAVRVQALSTLDGLGAMTPQLLEHAMQDGDAEVRRHAVRLSESLLSNDTSIAGVVLKLAGDPDVRVREQVALSLGEWDDPRATAALGQLAAKGCGDPWFRAAFASSAAKHPVDLLEILLKSAVDSAGRTAMTEQFIASARSADEKDLLRMLAAIAPGAGQAVADWQFAAVAGVLDVLDYRKLNLQHFAAGADSAAVVDRLHDVLDTARAVAKDSKASDERRTGAVALLGRGDDVADDIAVLGDLLGPQTSSTLQASALKALGRMRDIKAANAILVAWGKASPATRATMLQPLLARGTWTAALIDAIEQHRIKAGEVPPPTKARLLKLIDASLRQRATLALSADPPSTRKEVLEQYKSAVTLTGDAAKGAAIFNRTCTACHLLGGQGHAVGPDLSALTDRSRSALLIAILDPNAAVDGKYINYIVDLHDGRTLSGIISSENAASVSVLQPNGISDTVQRSDITTLRSSGLSLMPEGLEGGLRPQDMADLITYVAGAGR